MPTTLLAVAAKSAAPSDSRVVRAVDALPRIPTNLSDLERVASAGIGGAVAVCGFDGKGPGVGSLLTGGYLLYRAMTGHCAAYQAVGVSTASPPPSRYDVQSNRANEVSAVVTINRSAADIYQFWKEYKNLARVMEHVLKVEQDRRANTSHWVARGPLGLRFEWDAKTTVDIADHEIAWQSLPGADVDTTGRVQFKALPAGRGTEVRLSLRYTPPGGQAGVLLSKVFGQSPQAQIRADLRRLKHILETGEEPRTDGQPSGRR